MACLKTFCGCCSLRQGLIILGSIELIGIILSFLILLICLPTALNTAENSEEMRHVVISVLIILAVALIIYGIISTCLLIGVTKERTCLLLPRMVTSCMVLVSSPGVIVRLADFGGSAVVSYIFELVWEIFYLTVLISHYQELKEKNRADARDQISLPSYPQNPHLGLAENGFYSK